MDEKVIYFFVGDILRIIEDDSSFFIADNYAAMEWALRHDEQKIATTSMAHFSFDRMNEGYVIWLCCGEKRIKVEPHMSWSSQKDLRPSHNILKIFMAGCFDEDIAFDRNKIYED